MDYKVGNFYNIKWKDKTFEHCELLEIIPGTNLAAVRTPKYEYFEIHTDFLIPEEVKESVETVTTVHEPITVHLEEPLKSETVINADLSAFEELTNAAAKSVANEFKSSKEAGSDPLLKQKACKYEKFVQALEYKLQECEKVLKDEYALKKHTLKANTIKEALLEIQTIVEGQ